MRVGVMKLELHVLDAQSLKAKRHIVRGIKDRLGSRFECAVSEVGAQDLWQRAELGIAIVSLDAKGADSRLRSIEDYVRIQPGAMVISVDREVFPF